MQKAKKYDWKDSNLALFGSDTEKQVKKESAESEPAWNGAGQEPGLQIWRIVKFKVEHWDKEQYGEFYNGDSYIILNTYKEADGDELLYDVHFWIGKFSTQDEYCTAAYKTVELDTFLDDKPIQHREVQGHESSKFLSYFDTFTLLKGGADTGFRRVLPEAYATRLLHVMKTQQKKIVVKEVRASMSSLTSADVFILDLGNTIYQWNGDNCSHDEKFKAAAEVSKLKSSRGKVKSETLDESSSSEIMKKYLTDDAKEKSEKEVATPEKVLLKVSDADGSLDMDEIARGDAVSRDLFTSEDVFIFISGDHCYTWVGSGASIDERKNGLAYASNYLNKTEYPWLPLTVVAEGRETAEFNAAF